MSFPRILFPLLATALLAAPAFALDGREIMVRHEDAQKVSSFTAKAMLTTVKDGAKKEKSFTIWRKLKPDTVHFDSVTRFHTPAEVKGEAILFLENAKGENDIMIYLPAYQKVRRIERAQQSASFMGSDFSYSDITTPHFDDYVHVLKGEGPCPAVAPGAGEKAACYEVEAKPATDAIRERTGYSRIRTWVRKDNFMVVKNENYDAADALVKTSLLSQIEKVSGGKWFTKRIEVTTKKDGGVTTLQFSDVKTDVKLDDALFTQQALAKGER
jgi:outer membrane lipoprotein-sorting protein